MIRTGEEYKESLADGREVWIDGERVRDVTTHPAFKPIVDVRARIYDLAHEPEAAATMTYADDETGETCPNEKPPTRNCLVAHDALPPLPTAHCAFPKARLRRLGFSMGQLQQGFKTIGTGRAKPVRADSLE